MPPKKFVNMCPPQGDPIIRYNVSWNSKSVHDIVSKKTKYMLGFDFS